MLTIEQANAKTLNFEIFKYVYIQAYCVIKSNLFHMRILCIILTFIGTLCFQNLLSQDADFIHGNKAFMEGKYSDAVKYYQKVENKHQGGFGLYSNMARALAHQRQDAMAILYYEKALKLKPYNKQITNDLHQIRKRNPALDVPPNEFFLSKWWSKMSGVFSPLIWAILSIASLFLFGFFLIWWQIKHLSGVRNLTIGLCSMLLFLFALSMAWHRNGQVYHHNGMIIMTENCALKAGPDDQSPDITDLPPGTKVYKKDALGQWSMVTTSFGDVGWIQTDKAASI
jgi:tetratricopeptide (TPR) repeat protein